MLSVKDAIGWFQTYVNGFGNEGSGLEPLLELKLAHSYRVCGEAGRIALAMGYDTGHVARARILGLLHDIGRFPQYRDFGTFYDALSVDHGELGWKTVGEAGILGSLDEGDREAILDGIRFHNRKGIPADVRTSSLGMVRLVRDADKLDVFEIVELYLEEDRIGDLLPRIRKTNEISGGILDSLAETGRASYSQVRSVSDFLLVQLSWVFDLNYPPAFRSILDRGVIERIGKRLPPDSRVRELIEKARSFAVSSSSGGETS